MLLPIEITPCLELSPQNAGRSARKAASRCYVTPDAQAGSFFLLKTGVAQASLRFPRDEDGDVGGRSRAVVAGDIGQLFHDG